MLQRALYAGFELFVRLAWQHEEVVLYPVLDAAVAGGGDTPVEDQLEVAKGPGSEQVLSDARFRSRLEAAVLDRPGVSGRRLLSRVYPPFHGLSIEQKDP